MEIYKEFAFDSAHFLPNVPDGHKCKNMHGHTYRLRVCIKGEPDPHLGWLMDFKDLKDIVCKVTDQLDHKLINDVPGLENPTAENITIWIWKQIRPLLPLLSRIELYETPTTGVIYAGD
jgi:6-pyruvoyltetrahydropterin/6-carboxytetrahydropterin synthase